MNRFALDDRLERLKIIGRFTLEKLKFTSLSKYMISFIFIVVGFLTTVFLVALALGFVGPTAYKVKDIPDQQLIKLEHGTVRYQSSLKIGSVPILFLHGFNGSLNNWDTVWDKAEMCHGAIRLDIPGFGKSTWHENNYSLAAQSENLVEFLDKLAIQKVHIVGTSMGASLAAWFSAYHPNYIASTTLIAPSGWPNSLILKPYEKVAYSYKLSRAILLPIVKSKIYQKILPKSRLLQAIQVTGSYNKQWVEALPLLPLTTHVVWSEADKRVPIDFQQRIANELKNSILVFANKSSGHNVPGKDPNTIINIVCQL